MITKDPLDQPEIDKEDDRPLVIKVICILGMLISVLELVGSIYATQIRGSGYENDWTILLKLVPAINIICWIGFWTLRKATFILYCLNIVFYIWIQIRIGASPINFYTGLYILIAFIILGQLHSMRKFI